MANENSNMHASFDSAALAVSALAAVLAVSGQAGEYVCTNFAIGVTLIAIVLAFELSRPRRVFKSLAMGMILGLISWLIVGFILDKCLPESFEKVQGTKALPWMLVVTWAVVTGAFTILDRCWIQKKLMRP